MSQVYASAAPRYRASGWPGVLPLPARKKKFPPKGFTGADGADPTDLQIEAWINGKSNGNIAIRVPPGVVGYDADLYKAAGQKTHAGLVAKCGELPATWVSTSRTDGSGIRFFRIPEGVKLRGALGGIEIIQWHHRYAVVAPSIHPDTDRPYRLISPDGEIVEILPHPSELPELPQTWLEELREPEPSPNGDRPPRRTATGDWSRHVKDAYGDALAGLVKGSRHDTALAAALQLARYEDLGYPGAADALESLGRTFRADIADRARPADADKEWADIVESARARVASSPGSAARWEDTREARQRVEAEFCDMVPPQARAGASGASAEEDWPVLDPAAFHGLAGKVVRALAPYTEADPAGLLLTFLAMFGSAVGAAPHALADGCVHPLRLFVALVGDTSRSRKGTTSARVRSVFELADPTWTYDRVMSGFGSGEAIVDEVRDPKMGVDKDGEPVVLDKGVEDKRLLVLEGEFARILAVAAREGSTISAIIRDAWDLGRLAARARQQKSVATGAHVSIVTNVTVEELRRRLSETEMANGLANRFLFTCVRRSQLLPCGGQLDPAELHGLGTKVRSALEAARKISRVERSPAAEKRWAEMYAEMARGPGGLLGAITARAEAQALRLQVGYALLDGKATVEEAHLEAAYAVWRYCEDSAAHVFGDALGDDVADRLLAAIRAEGDDGLDFTAQTAVFGRHVKAKRLAAARAELEELGLIRTVKEETDGRPRMVSFAEAKKAKQAKEGGQR
jgi:hypothetical protein